MCKKFIINITLETNLFYFREGFKSNFEVVVQNISK